MASLSDSQPGAVQEKEQHSERAGIELDRVSPATIDGAEKAA